MIYLVLDIDDQNQEEVEKFVKLMRKHYGNKKVEITNDLKEIKK